MGEIGQDRIARYQELIEREQETLEELCQRLTCPRRDSEGKYMPPETLVEVCTAWDVPYGRIMAWLQDDAGRFEVYQRSLKTRADALVAETIAIADDDKPRIEEYQMKDGRTVPVVIPAEHQSRKLKVDTRFRAAAKWDPQRFGDAEVPPTTPRRNPSEVPTLEAARRVAFSLALGAQIVERGRREPRLLEAVKVEEAATTDEGVGEI